MKFYLNPDSEAPHIQRRLAWSGVLGTLALASAGQVMRERPGGPFISLTGDVIPFVAAVVAIIIGFCCLRAYTLHFLTTGGASGWELVCSRMWLSGESSGYLTT